MKSAFVKKRHAVANMHVKATRLPILSDRQLWPEHAPLTLGKVFASTGELKHFIVRESPIPNDHLFHRWADFQSALGRKKGTERPFFVHQHTVGKQLQARTRVTQHELMTFDS